ncbi:aminotransferase class I/II-fold pyridoxal phosphate-dependent enzyme [Priestia megaterium]|uniref:aminotransferase class I/II-fold pyridoxal phosphate-dependent enzyme n=1 Tax=Priestia megaterium TaxID=1404 RepID=UPI002A69A7E2|nr:aminotransferase class I/II-fold pyridoxal phosphate-dependent enzyme [Priestia megaterium]MDY0944159.1 aminotransferase class I/II-fold pyridoxal phosphate-dependent enzyme [Priestia megaterium]
MEFAKRMNQFSENIFSKLLESKRNKLEKGEMVIDLSVGTPNIPPATHIREALCMAAAEGENYIYAINDQRALLEAVSYWYEKRYGVVLNSQTEICSLLGSQEGLAHISLSIINEGDLVLVPDPFYPAFANGPSLAGAKLYYMPQKKENGYVICLEDIPENVARKAKFMLVSYPNNPTTAIAPECFYYDLIAFAKKYDIIVLHDNAYSDLVYEGGEGKSFLSFPGALDVGVEFNSLSKTYGLAGARVGFCIGNEAIISSLKTLKSNMDYGMFLPIQKAAIAAITGNQDCVEDARKAYEQRANVLCKGFNAIGWNIEKPKATMFVWTSIPSHYKKSEDFVIDMLEKAGVLVTPGSAFGPLGEGYVRIALVQDEEVIKKAIQAVHECGILKGLTFS